MLGKRLSIIRWRWGEGRFRGREERKCRVIGGVIRLHDYVFELLLYCGILNVICIRKDI